MQFAVNARFCRPVESIILASRPSGFESRKRGHVSQKAPAQRFRSTHLLAGVSLAALIFFGFAAPPARAQNFDRGWGGQEPPPPRNPDQPDPLPEGPTPCLGRPP